MDPQIFISLFNSMITASTAQAGALVPDGVELTYRLLAIMIAWFLFQMMIADEIPDTVASILNVCVKASFILFLLNSWNGGVVGDFFTGTMDQLAMRASGQTGQGSGLSAIMQSIDAINHNTFSSTPGCKEVPGPTHDPEGNPLPPSKVIDCSDGSSGGWSSILKVFGSPVAIIISALLKALTTGFLVILAAAYMLIVNLGAMLVGIGLTLGPVLAPWFLLPAASFLFDGWLRFMITAGLMKVVGAVVMAIVNASILTARVFILGKFPMNAVDSSLVDVYSLVIVLIITLIGIFMMLQVPGIARGLITGSPNIGTGFTSFSKGFVPSRGGKS